MKETNAIKILRRIIIILSVICLCLLIYGMATAETAWDGSVAAAFSDTTGNGTKDHPFLIKDGSELALFAAIVNGVKTDYPISADVTSLTICGKLDADIVLNEGLQSAWTRQWTPIGNSSHKYVGTFDGSGRKVSGVYIDNSSTMYGGLFGYAGSGGEIKNVTVDGYINCQGDGARAGGIVGASLSTLTNCVNRATVSSASQTGGIAGYSGGNIDNCDNYGDVDGEGSNTGGIIGYSIHASTDTFSIMNCENNTAGIPIRITKTNMISPPR